MLGTDDGISAGPLDSTMDIEISADAASPEELQEIVDWAVAHSPMADGLMRAVPLNVNVKAVEMPASS